MAAAATNQSDFKQSDFTLRLGNRDKPTRQSVFGASGITDKALEGGRPNPRAFERPTVSALATDRRPWP
jgi:hypothetical protein